MTLIVKNETTMVDTGRMSRVTLHCTFLLGVLERFRYTNPLNGLLMHVLMYGEKNIDRKRSRE